jgi:hypothetical protein
MAANRRLTRAIPCIADDLRRPSPRSLLDCSLPARRPAELVETLYFFNIEKHPQVIQLPLRLDGLARQLVKLAYIKLHWRCTRMVVGIGMRRRQPVRLAIHVY